MPFWSNFYRRPFGSTLKNYCDFIIVNQQMRCTQSRYTGIASSVAERNFQDLQRKLFLLCCHFDFWAFSINWEYSADDVTKCGYSKLEPVHSRIILKFRFPDFFYENLLKQLPWNVHSILCAFFPLNKKTKSTKIGFIY